MGKLIPAKSSIKFTPRSPQLRAVEGWYTTPPSPLYKLYKDSGSKLAFNRWLRRCGVQENSRTMKSLIVAGPPTTYKVSCQWRDFARCSQMYSKKYFVSCLAEGGMHHGSQYQYCQHLTNVGILYIPDMAGHIMSRAFFALHEDKLFPFRFYGDGNLRGCFDDLATRLSVKIQDFSRTIIEKADFVRVLGSTVNEYVYLDQTFSYGIPALDDF